MEACESPNIPFTILYERFRKGKCTFIINSRILKLYVFQFPRLLCMTMLATFITIA